MKPAQELSQLVVTLALRAYEFKEAKTGYCIMRAHQKLDEARQELENFYEEHFEDE